MGVHPEKPLLQPTDLRFRPPTMADVASVTALCALCDVSEYGEPDITEADVESEWTQPGFELAQDAWLVEGGGEDLLAYCALWQRIPILNLIGDLYVHPERIGSGIETEMLARVERRARSIAADAPFGEIPTLGFFNATVNEWKRALLEANGFTPVRTFFRMAIDLAGGFERAAPIEGIEIRPFDPERDARAAHETLTESFADHYRPRREDFDDWRARRFGHASFDPGLWSIAWAGEEAVGALVAYVYPDIAWVGELGVRRDWRRRGVGRALLLRAFEEILRRGQRRVCLGVDAESPTGATRLYERAGMSVQRQHDLFQKPLR